MANAPATIDVSNPVLRANIQNAYRNGTLSQAQVDLMNRSDPTLLAGIPGRAKDAPATKTIGLHAQVVARQKADPASVIKNQLAFRLTELSKGNTTPETSGLPPAVLAAASQAAAAAQNAPPGSIPVGPMGLPSTVVDAAFSAAQTVNPAIAAATSTAVAPASVSHPAHNPLLQADKKTLLFSGGGAALGWYAAPMLAIANPLGAIVGAAAGWLGSKYLAKK